MKAIKIIILAEKGIEMEDLQIISLYFKRDEAAISETATKYGAFCHDVALNILSISADADECVNDTYLKTWNSIPPQRPNILKAYIGKITRNLAINQYEKKKSKKRDYTLEIALEELNECISSNNVEKEFENNELVNALNNFLSVLSKDKRKRHKIISI